MSTQIAFLPATDFQRDLLFEYVRKSGYSEGYEKLYNRLRRELGDKEHYAMNEEGKIAKTDDGKIPSFRVPKFTGDTLAGDTYIESVDNVFRSAAMAQYLLSEVFCETRISWSDAFASRLRESIRESDILGFIATEMKATKNVQRFGHE